MGSLCAWCVAEGRERDIRGVSHGICEWHMQFIGSSQHIEMTPAEEYLLDVALRRQERADRERRWIYAGIAVATVLGSSLFTIWLNAIGYL